MCVCVCVCVCEALHSRACRCALCSDKHAHTHYLVLSQACTHTHLGTGERDYAIMHHAKLIEDEAIVLVDEAAKARDHATRHCRHARVGRLRHVGQSAFNATFPHRLISRGNMQREGAQKRARVYPGCRTERGRRRGPPGYSVCETQRRLKGSDVQQQACRAYRCTHAQQQACVRVRASL
jgi:hypothetical protein